MAHRSPRAARLAAALAATLLAAACGGEEPLATPPTTAPAAAGGPPPNVLVVTVDCLRADRCGAYGHPGGATPNLDALARESVVFERAYAQAPFTAPSHASLFTGLHSKTHGVVHWDRRLAPEVETLAQLLGNAGWRTGAFYNNPGIGWTEAVRGFEVRHERYCDTWERTVEAFLGWLDGGPADQPFLGFVHLWDVHRPYGYRDWSVGSPGTELEFAL